MVTEVTAKLWAGLRSRGHGGEEICGGPVVIVGLLCVAWFSINQYLQHLSLLGVEPTWLGVCRAKRAHTEVFRRGCRQGPADFGDTLQARLPT